MIHLFSFKFQVSLNRILVKMFRDAFKYEVGLLTVDKYLQEKLWVEIDKNYSQKNRHYHNIQHLDNLLQQLLQVKHLIKDWTLIILAIAYHDIIYNTLKQDNEAKSAELAVKRLALLHLPVEQIAKCQAIILATKSHHLSKTNDINLFTDADLSILGTTASDYKNYSDCIRNEYNFYPDFLYKPGRIKVLQHFLAMERIFKTDYFFHKYEIQARKNINNELSLFL